MLARLRAIPVIGHPIADLLELVPLTYPANLGHDDPHFGHSTGPANVPNGFGCSLLAIR